jgi:predicted amidohydrolase YtcJ
MRERPDKLVLLSKSVFTAADEVPFDGFIVIEGNRIQKVGPRAQADSYIRRANRSIDVGDRTVIPGLTDDHVFFTGWALLSLGADLSDARTDEEGIELLQTYARRHSDANKDTSSPIFGHNWSKRYFSPHAEDKLTCAFPRRPVVAFTTDRNTCWMNQAARDRYCFSPEECYAEKIWRMIRDYITLPEVKKLYPTYMHMLNRRGVTQIKEMSYDDYYGFTDEMDRLERTNELTIRISMMSQPVGYGMNLNHGYKMLDCFQGPFVRFTGFNRMTDRSIGSGLAELKEPYLSTPNSCCGQPVDWDLISSELFEADKAGFRYSLHCQGDAAVAHTVDLFEKCHRDAQGRLVNRHAMTDLELSDPKDIVRFGAMGGICEVYPQIQSLDNKEDLLAMVDRQIGRDRFRNYWNRRKMWDAGCVVCAGTDLPLMFPSIGEALYCGVGGYFNDGGCAREENMLTTSEMLRAWTANGAYDCLDEERLGTLEEGKLADIAVLESNVFATSPKNLRNVNAAMTISDGRIVYDELD